MDQDTLLEYARERLRENIFEFNEDQIIASIDEFYHDIKRK